MREFETETSGVYYNCINYDRLLGGGNRLLRHGMKLKGGVRLLGAGPLEIKWVAAFQLADFR